MPFLVCAQSPLLTQEECAMRTQSSLLARCGYVALALAACATLAAGEVLELTDDNLNATIAENEYVLLMFYAPWCGACRRFKPEYEWADQAAAEQGLPLVFARMHADDYADTAASFGLSRFPSWVMFNGSVPSRIHNPFSGPALMTQLHSYFGKPLTSAARELHGLGGTTDWLFWRGNDFSTLQSAVMAFIPDPEQTGEPLHDPDAAAALVAAFHEASITMVERIRFGWTSSTDVLKAFHLPTDRPVIALYKDYDEGKQLYTAPRSVDSASDIAGHLVHWVSRNDIPLSTTIDHFNIRHLQRNKNIIVHVFVPEEVSEHPVTKSRLVEAVSAAVLPLEEEGLWSRGDVTVGVTNGQKYHGWLTQFGLARGRFPSFGLSDPASGRFFGHQLSLEAEGELNVVEDLVTPKGDTAPQKVVLLPKEELQAFLRGFFEGSLTPAPTQMEQVQAALPDHPLAAMAMIDEANKKAAAEAEAAAESQ